MSKKLATTEAEKCVQLLKGDWKIRVWNNMGWHWEVIQNNLSIRKSGEAYSANITCLPGCASYGGWCKFGDTEFGSEKPNKYKTIDYDPNKAVEEAIRQYSDWWEIQKAEPESIGNSIENWRNHG